MVSVTMTSIVRFYNYNGRKIKIRGFLLPVISVLVFLFLLTGKLTLFGDYHNTPNDGSRCVLLVEGFSSVPPSPWTSTLTSTSTSTSTLSTSTSSTSTSTSIRVRVRSNNVVRKGLPWTLFCNDEHVILDDHHSSANATVRYSDLVNIVSDAEFMNVETKKRFLESLNDTFLNVSKDVGDAHFIDESSYADATTNTKEEQYEKEIKANTNTSTCGVPTIEGLWKDDGSPFHASGAWQTTPLLMKGAFVDDIHNVTRDDGYLFPSWKEVIELACDGSTEHDDHNIDDEDSYEEHIGHDESENNVGDGDDYDNDNDNDEHKHQYGMCVGDSNDDEDFDDGDEDYYLWDDENQYHEDKDDCDNPPSRLIQYSWSRRDAHGGVDSDYYHADVNTNWLDTFEIKQFGPFNDPDSLEALLRTEDEDNSDRHTARTLLVNDVDRWFPKLSDWMDRRFNSNKSEGGVLPARWRRDDAQLSLSHPMGGIGPHVDDYDVFLIQLDGERTWDVLWEENSHNDEVSESGAKGHDASTISVRDETDCILPESSMNGVRILNVTKLQSLQKHRCGKTRTRLTRLHLRPGDCLYLPPRVLHCGTAAKASRDCMTLSVGCRAPSALELLDGLSDLMKKSATTATPKAMTSVDSSFPSDAAIQAFHRRYTNAEIGSHEITSIYDNHTSGEDNDALKMSSSSSQSSWLSPQVKNEMKNLVLDAVRTALDDDENVLDPLVGRFVTKSNRLEEEAFGLGGDDGSSLPSFSYPKALGGIAYGKQQGESEDSDLDIWANATTALTEVFGSPKFNGEPGDSFLRRAEGIAFAWSSVYDKERRIRKYRLYAQGRPPFEVLEALHEGVEEEVDNPSELFVSAPSSVVGRLMDRITNGPPLNRDFVVDELQILIDVKQKGAKYTTTRLLYDLVKEGLLYGGYCDQ